ncbi:MAG: BNR-4 repeat-containing protein [Balneolaceae bacterium]
MGNRIKALVFIVLPLTCLQLSHAQQGGDHSGHDHPAFAKDGAWCWFSDPRAVFYDGTHQRTYAGWITGSGEVEVGYYDHQTGDISTHVLEDNFQVDDHNNPSLLFDREGYLMVFYSEHSTEKPIYLQKSSNPEDITEWEERRSLDLNDSEKYEGYSDTYTYTNPQYLSGEDKLYLFWRGSDFKPNYAVSGDEGESWSKGDILILPDREYRDRRPYLKVSSNGKDRIHFAFTDGHPRDEPTNSIYYMQYRDDRFLRPDGTEIGNIEDGPVPPEESSLVYDASESGERAWIWDVAQDEEGHPVIVYAKFPDNETHIYCYARWNGEQWKNYELVDSGSWFPETPEGDEEREPNYSGGIVLDHENPGTVYLSRQKEGVFEIEKWTTPDGGESWEEEAVTRNSQQDNVRPFAVRNAGEGDPIQLLWMENSRYVHYTDYRSVIRMDLQ